MRSRAKAPKNDGGNMTQPGGMLLGVMDDTCVIDGQGVRSSLFPSRNVTRMGFETMSKDLVHQFSRRKGRQFNVDSKGFYIYVIIFKGCF